MSDHVIRIKITTESDDAALQTSTTRLNALTDRLGVTDGATRKFNESMDMLTVAAREGVISEDQLKEAIHRLTVEQDAATQKMHESADATKETESLFDQLKGKIGEMIGEFLALREVVKIAFDAFKDAAAEEHLFAGMIQNAKSLAGATDEEAKSLTGWIEGMEIASGVEANKLTPSFNRLLGVTHSVTDSQRLMQLALGLQARGMGDVNETLLSMSRAYENMEPLNRGFGLTLRQNHKEGETWTDTLNRMIGMYGDAGMAMKDAGMESSRLGVIWGQTSKALGEDLIPAGKAVITVLKDMAVVVVSAFKGFELLGAAMGYVANIAANGFSAANAVFKDQVKEILASADDVIDRINGKVALIPGKVSESAAVASAIRVKAYEDEIASIKRMETEQVHQLKGQRMVYEQMRDDYKLDVDARRKAADEIRKINAELAKGSGAKRGGGAKSADTSAADEARATEELAKAETREAEAAFHSAEGKVAITNAADNAIKALNTEKTAVLQSLVEVTAAKIKAANGDATKIQSILKASATKSLTIQKDYAAKEAKILQDAANRRVAINKKVTADEANEEKKRFNAAVKQAKAYDKLEKTIANQHAKTYKKMSNDELYSQAQKLRKEIEALRASGAEGVAIEQAISDANIKIKEIEYQITVNMMQDAAVRLARGLAESFGLGKEFAYAQAIINTYLGATNALTTGDPYTAVFRAAAVVVAGMADVVQIANTNPGKAEKGAYLTGPTNVLAGEAGPELILPARFTRLFDRMTGGGTSVNNMSTNNARQTTVVNMQAFGPAEADAHMRAYEKKRRASALGLDRSIAGGTLLRVGSKRGPRYPGRA